MTPQEAIIKLYQIKTLIEQEYSIDFQIALDMSVQALTKQIPKKPLNKQGIPVFGYCPNPKCNIAVTPLSSPYACKECLQCLDWSNDK